MGCNGIARTRVLRWAGSLLLLGIVPGATAQTRSDTTSRGIYYEVSGTGEPLVFLHAFSVDRRMWGPQIAAFERGYTVIRYDLRGHGQSPPPGAPYTSYDDLLSVLDAVGVGQATLVGLSAGAEAAIDFALAHPERVRRLVLADPGLGGFQTPPLAWANPVFQAAGAGEPERAARLWAGTPIMAMRNDTTATATVTQLVMDNWRLWTYRRTEVRIAPPAIGRLGEISVPVLVLVGSHDLPHIFEVARLIVAGVRQGRLLTIPGAGHISNLDAPGPFNSAIAAFLTGQ